MDQAGPSRVRSILHLFDPEFDETFSIEVNDLDYQRAEIDPEFAQSLLYYAKNNQNCHDLGSTENIETSVDRNNTVTVNERNTHCTWTYDATTGLIRSMETNMDDLNHPKKRKHVFENVSNELLSQGFVFSDTACYNKWRSLLRSYRSTKDKKGKSGTGPTRFLFFTQIDELLGSKPANKCDHALESTFDEDEAEVTLEVETNIPSEDITIQENNTPEVVEQTTPLPSKTSKRKKKSEIEFEKKRRHEERMAIEREKIEIEKQKLDTLKSILEKLKD